ncbi:transcriptional regulator [Spirochaeta africana]|uniref:Bacterial regulatory protein, arsR family n=1 Tax=Spirochaeta africana (strain ATCC 700263 / DSM 8902 / Z-7692) TaxID=889378 RepID=H9UFJ9_SPIAZ|nr:transcriptional regulator [Spirochaeta africana]AFG36292.1 Bacterial regulatory protein, arsR family [Spirochaeta africana DSM 8902]
MAELYTRFDGVFFEKTRLSLVTLLYREEKLSFNSLKSRLKLSDGSLYSHLEKLIQAGYAEKTKEYAGLSLQTVYGLTGYGRAEFRAYLAFVQEILQIEEVRK